MKTRTKAVTGIIALMLSCVLLFTSIVICNNTNNSNFAEANIRTINYSSASMDTQSIFEEFDNVSLSTEGTTTSFSGTKKLDTSCLSDADLIAIEENFGEDFTNVTYNLTVDSDTYSVELSLGFVLENGEVIVDTLNGVLIFKEDGQSDALLFIDNESVLLSELCGSSALDDIGLFSKLWKGIKNVVNKIVKVLSDPLKIVIIALTPVAKALGGVVAIVIIPFTIYQSNSNYNNNTKLSTMFVPDSSGYIVSQSTYKFKTWKMGCKTIYDNGCGAIATYNALVFTGKITNNADEVKNNDLDTYRRTNLANIIKGYELSAGTLIEGVIGINPEAIEPMLRYYGVTVKTYTSLGGNIGFEYACDNLKSNQMAILCYWWNENGGVGAHYVAIKKDKNDYTILNDNITIKTSISEVLHGSKTNNGFIQGWIVTK